MKLKEHLPMVRAALLPYDTHHLRSLYKQRNCTSARYRWAIFWAAADAGRLDPSALYETIDNPEDSVTDEHVDTLLRAVVRNL